MPRSFPFLLTVASMSLAACTVGPDYAEPKSTAAPEWVEPASSQPVDLAWWNSFGDAMLSSLVERALASAPDVRVAEARLAEARASRDAVYGGSGPQGGLNGSVTENQLSENGQLPVANIPGFDRRFSLFDLGFDASWELDLWGRQARERQSADAQADAALEAMHEARLRLAAEVARSYVDLRAGQEEVTLRKRLADAALGRADLASKLFESGELSRLDFDQTLSAAKASEAQVLQAEARTAAAAYRIAALLGVAPETIVPELMQPAFLPQTPTQIAAGLRSDLLERRPDVRKAERELAAATANVGVATADLFPRFSLFGSLGSQARNAGDLTSSDSVHFSVGPQFSWPIFSMGSIRARIRTADARADGAAASWEGTVASALADSESAINRQARAQAALAAMTGSLASQRGAHRLASQRFQSGEDSRIQWLSADSELAQAELAVSQSHTAALDAAIALYKALGGGWQQ